LLNSNWHPFPRWSVRATPSTLARIRVDCD